MKKAVWLGGIIVLVLVAAVLFRARDAQIVPAEIITPTDSVMLSDEAQRKFEEASASAPSLRNLAEPHFDAPPTKMKLHREFQLAKGEERIVARPGEMVYLHVHCELEVGWKTYPKQKSKWVNSNKISLLNAEGRARIDGVASTTPAPAHDVRSSEVLGEDIVSFSKPFMYTIPVQINTLAPYGDSVIQLQIYSGAVCAYQ